MEGGRALTMADLDGANPLGVKALEAYLHAMGLKVTRADREAEQLVRKSIAERFPNDTIQGEEFAEQSGDSDYRWVVDPIDGTLYCDARALFLASLAYGILGIDKAVDAALNPDIPKVVV